MNLIYNDGKLFAAFQVGQRLVERDHWIEFARKCKFVETKQQAVSNARSANWELVKALQRIRRWLEVTSKDVNA